MHCELNSLSSSLMLGITLYRNKKASNAILGQAGYALTVIVAAVETLAASAFLALSLVLSRFSPNLWDPATKWLGSSSFSLGWSLVNFSFNLFVPRLVADEKSARTILASGNFMMRPEGAVF